MTFAALGSFASANRTAAAATFVFATTAAINNGELGVLIIGHDNTNGTNKDFQCVTNITDASGNAWLSAGYWNSNATSASHAGVAIWYCKHDQGGLASGQNITLTLAGSPAAVAVTGHRFSCDLSSSPFGFRNSVAIEGAAFQELTATDPSALQLTGLENREHLVIRATAAESNVTTYTATAAFTSFTHTNSTAVIAAATSMGARGEYKIETATSTTSSDPTYAAADCVSMLVAFCEIEPSWYETTSAARFASVSSSSALSLSAAGPVLVALGLCLGSITSVTHNGTALTLEGSVTNGLAGTGNSTASIYGGPSNSGTVTANFAVNSSGSIWAGYFLNIHYTQDAFGAFSSASSTTSTTPSLSSTIKPKSMLFTVLSGGKTATSYATHGLPNYAVFKQSGTLADNEVLYGLTAGKTAAITTSHATASGVGWAMAGLEINYPVAIMGQASL